VSGERSKWPFRQFSNFRIGAIDPAGQSQSINKVATRFDVYIKGNRNDFFATRGADIAILTGFGMDLLVMNY
jgi:hypothetical protein